MHRRLPIIVAIFSALFHLHAPASGQGGGGAVPATRREVAITFDDLPAVSVVGSGVAAAERMTDRLIRAIRENRVPAIGFVNEVKLRTDSAGAAEPRRIGLLQRWVRAGLELGNHTYSHRSLHQIPLGEYQEDVLRGEVETRRLMAAAGTRPRFFRHPFLHAGRDTAVHRALGAFLATHGYRIAPVTIDDNDYIYAAAYARAGDRGDAATQKRVAAAYLVYMDSIFDYYERQSSKLFGREIPQVLLLHANQLNADHFGALAQVIRRRGYRFVPLERALDDHAYQSPDRFTGAGGISWLHRWALTSGGTGALVPGEPAVPSWVVDLSTAPAAAR